MADTPQEESVVSQPTYKTEETTQAFATLLNKEETARNEELDAPKSEEGEVDLTQDNDDPLLEDLDVEEIVDNDEASTENEETLYDITVNGNNQKVTLNELMRGYSRESDYTKKTMDLSNQRKDVESMQNNLKKEFEAVKSSRSQYALQLEELSKNLKQEENIDWENLYQTDPAEYVKLKADSDRRKETLGLAQQEQMRIQQEQRSEQEQVYNNYIANERKILAEKLPVYADKNKSAEFTKRLSGFAKESGYSDQEISMMVDHRAVLLLADAYRYNQLKKTKLSGNKVNKAPRVVTSNAANIREDSNAKQNIDKRMTRLKQSGHVRDAQSVLKEMYFNE
jgi:predicted lactoylglutathione lyase|tara:strand:+ start:3296 stop:4312 length:1017 start_codon:yes stop_codon:yes gene_type:complete